MLRELFCLISIYIPHKKKRGFPHQKQQIPVPNLLCFLRFLWGWFAFKLLQFPLKKRSTGKHQKGKNKCYLIFLLSFLSFFQFLLCHSKFIDYLLRYFRLTLRFVHLLRQHFYLTCKRFYYRLHFSLFISKLKRKTFVDEEEKYTFANVFSLLWKNVSVFCWVSNNAFSSWSSTTRKIVFVLSFFCC